jgi:glycyl-tRNA synthetase beta chain
MEAKTKDLLLEIGLEEMPARFVRGAVNQLGDKVQALLESARIAYGALHVYATPRRLAVLVEDVALRGTDIHDEVKGPSRKIAQDAAGNWSKAALGFARSQGVDPATLTFKELGGVEYIYAARVQAGVETANILPDGLKNLITGMSFPKNMRWGSYELKFVRPIRWLVALFGEDVIPFEITDVKTGRRSRGHRFLGSGETEFARPSDYVDALRREYVLVDIAEREALIVAQIEALAASKGWTVHIQEDLREEVLFLVEWPTALYGAFSEEFLSIPKAVLITSMREHQRYFPVLDAAGNLLPYFVTVRNGDSVHIDEVARGNEKVLRARLSDAKFFYEEDQKLTIDACLAKLENIVYQVELGSVADKVRRIEAITKQLVRWLAFTPAEKEEALRAAHISKFDLVTQMVYEFPELQGTMGEDYARRLGETEYVAVAIDEHYQPRYAGDSAPSTKFGAVVALADKIDTIVGSFSLGKIPTGSQDPYALRRQASGILQIIMAHNMPITLAELFRLALLVYSVGPAFVNSTSETSKPDFAGMPAEQPVVPNANWDTVRTELENFFLLRVKNVLLSEQNVRHDIVDAVLATDFLDLRRAVLRASTLSLYVQGDRTADFKLVVDALTRVNNLAQKAEGTQVANPALFVLPAEQSLYDAWSKLGPLTEEAMARDDYAAALDHLAALKEPINAYFNDVMVMDQDAQIKANRLAQLKQIADVSSKIADFGKLVW